MVSKSHLSGKSLREKRYAIGVPIIPTRIVDKMEILRDSFMAKSVLLSTDKFKAPPFKYLSVLGKAQEFDKGFS